MRKIIIPLNAFNSEDVMKQGQGAFIPCIAEAGANGVEIRRELLSNHDFPLIQLQQLLKSYHLHTIFSAPVELWREDGNLNEEQLESLVSEVIELDVSVLKLPLGHFQPDHSDVRNIIKLLDKFPRQMKLLIENDQTPHGGTIHNLSSFFENVSNYDIPVKMTFDIGNWKYTGEDVYEAVERLGKYVEYIHLKHVEKQNGDLITLPLPMGKQEEEWEVILQSFPNHLPIALEFPLETNEAASMYVQYLSKEEVGWSV